MYRLKEWFLEASDKGFRGHGDCYDNPNFFSGDFITTSRIMRVEVENKEERLKLFTGSGSCYILKYADINDSEIESTQKVLEGMNVAVDLQRCISLKEERMKAAKKKVAELLNRNELYVIMTGTQGVAEAFFKRKDDVIVPVPVSVHIGVFRDSIIVSAAGLCDWRIFPSLFDIEPYHWSDNLEAVYIENVGENFMFAGSNGEILCKSGEVTVIKSEEYVGEELISPDIVNGKCLLSAGISEPYNRLNK